MRGWHVLAVAVGAFAVILSANIAMVTAAVDSFPGLVAKNSYVASQQFNARAAERARLGWRLDLAYVDGALVLDARDAQGAQLSDLAVSAVIGLSVDARTDRELVLTETEAGYVAPIALEPGQWRVQVDAVAPSGDQMGGSVTIGVDG